MRYILLLLLGLFFSLPVQLWSKNVSVEVSLAHADWNSKTKELQFDLLMKALDKPFYLSFSDVVIALPKANVDITALNFGVVAGTTQLLNLGKDLLSFPGIRTKVKEGKDTVYFVIQLMPNQFLDAGDFFEQTVFISTVPGENRIGRFSIKGMSQLPSLLKPYFSTKGLSSLILAFDPNDDLRAVEISAKWVSCSPNSEPLKYFELEKRQDEVVFSWKWHSSKQTWQIWSSVDQKNWVLLKEGKGGNGFKVPAVIAADDSTTNRSYRLTYANEKGNTFVVCRHIVY